MATNIQPVVYMEPTAPIVLSFDQDTPQQMSMAAGSAGGIETVNNLAGTMTVGAISQIQAIAASAAAIPFALVLANATAGAIVVTPPANVAGVFFEVKKTDSSGHAVSVAATVEGTANPQVTSQYGTMRILGDGTSWWNV